MSQELDMEFAGIGCASIDNVEIPSSSGAFFKPADGKNLIRFLQGPVLSYVSQEWDKDRNPVGDKKKYAYGDPEAKKDKNAKLVMTFLIYSYKEEKVMLWEISQKSILEEIKSINGIQPDMSAFDIQLTKSKGANGVTDYKIAQGPNKPFTLQEVIDEVIEKGLNARLAEREEDEEEGVSDEQQTIDAQIAEASKPTAESRAAHVQKLKDDEAAENARIKAEAEKVFE